MTVSSRPRLVARLRSVGAVALIAALAGLVSSGCDDKHIGRKCDLDTADDAGAASGNESATINSQAAECPTRLCLQAAAMNGPTGTGALCSAECSTDDDCGGGQTGTTNGLCQTGFRCAIATTVGPFCCKKLCVCKDFLTSGAQTTPPICEPGSGGTCANVH